MLGKEAARRSGGALLLLVSDTSESFATARPHAGPAAGIYISYPFCEQKCTYCNFASGVFPKRLAERYVEALCAEIAATDFTAFAADTLYLGGGTPSLLPPGQLEKILRGLPANHWREAAIEASPGAITWRQAQAWARLGITRVSLGVQSFVTREARASGRKHTPGQVADEIATLRAAGLNDFNIDLLAGLPYQSRASWETSLEWVERLEAPHVSVYMLEVDDESRLGEELRAGGGRYHASAVPGDEQITELYLLAVERLRRSGLEQYEISNFARPGRRSLHNWKYWTGAPYLGFGADAHSFDGVRRRWANVKTAADYVARFEQRESPRAFVEALDEKRRRQERLFTGLRLTEGVALPAADWRAYEAQLSPFLRRHWIEFDGGKLKLTPAGILYSNEIFEVFV